MRVLNRATDKTTTVKAGRSYLVKAKLFASQAGPRVMRILLAALVAAVVLAAPARAQTPAPTVETFAVAASTRTSSTSPQACPAAIVAAGGRDGGPFLRVPCGSPQLRLRLPATANIVEFFVRAPQGGRHALRRPRATSTFCDGDRTIDTATIAPAPSDWTPIVLTDSTGAARIDNVVVRHLRPILRHRRSTSTTSRSRPSTSPTPRSAPGRRSRSASTRRSAGQFTCVVDADTVVPCTSPFSPAGFAAGRAHAAGARDRRLRAPRHDAGADDVHGRAARSAAAAAAGHRRRRRRRPRRERQLPGERQRQPGRRRQRRGRRRLRPAPARQRAAGAGQTAVVRTISGEVFVKLPGRSLKQDGGFIPLKGVASVPVGSTVDARKGELEMKSAANGFAASDRRAKQQTARIKAGIFAIKQKRAKKGTAKSASISTDIGLLSPTGAEAQCQKGPAKGIVRSLSMVAKGYYRALGGASTATARNATFVTTDRCDGTVTEVGKGRVTLARQGLEASR